MLVTPCRFFLCLSGLPEVIRSLMTGFSFAVMSLLVPCCYSGHLDQVVLSLSPLLVIAGVQSCIVLYYVGDVMSGAYPSSTSLRGHRRCWRYILLFIIFIGSRPRRPNTFQCTALATFRYAASTLSSGLCSVRIHLLLRLF